MRRIADGRRSLETCVKHWRAWDSLRKRESRDRRVITNSWITLFTWNTLYFWYPQGTKISCRWDRSYHLHTVLRMLYEDRGCIKPFHFFQGIPAIHTNNMRKKGGQGRKKKQRDLARLGLAFKLVIAASVMWGAL